MPVERFQILALDGGGVKALFSANVLAYLEEDLDIRVADAFDLITGTSAGGIIALGLGAGMRPREIVERFERMAAEVFPQSRRRWWRWPARLVRPSYDAVRLRESLREVLGDRLLGDSVKRLVIPSWDVHSGRVHVFKTPHHERLRRDWRVPMVDVAMATSAAPAYFPAARVDGHRLIDGGVWANNPSVVGIAEAVSMLDVPVSAIGVLNIGTTANVGFHPRRLDRGGFGLWALHATGLVITAGSRGGQGIAEHLIGQEDYSRFDADVPEGLYAMDKADPDDLAAHAAAASRDLSPVFSARFMEHAAGRYEALPFCKTSAED